MVKYNVVYIGVILKLKNDITMFALTILSASCVYVATLCYFQVTEYEGKLKSFEVLLKDTNEKNISLHEEDLVIIRLIEEQNKLIKAQDDKIRIQDANIAESRAKSKRK
jgi:hypothetical protein